MEATPGYQEGMPGYKEGTTSRDAALAVAGRAETLREKSLDALRKMPLTADEVAMLLDESVLTIRPRLTELRKAGLIARTGDRRQNNSGKFAHVFSAVVEA